MHELPGQAAQDAREAELVPRLRELALRHDLHRAPVDLERVSRTAQPTQIRKAKVAYRAIKRLLIHIFAL